MNVAAGFFDAGFTDFVVLTPTAGTSPFIVKTGPGVLGQITSTTTNQSHTISFYDSVDITAIGASNLIFTVQLSAFVPVTLRFPFINGLVAQMNGGAPNNNINITYS